MAENKKSFVAYADWSGMFQALPDDVAGKLIKHLFAYVNDQNPATDDYVINALFEPIKSTLKRDLKKWETHRAQRSEAGKRSAEARATKSNERSTTDNEEARKATVSVSVSVSDNVSKEVEGVEPPNPPPPPPPFQKIETNYPAGIAMADNQTNATEAIKDRFFLERAHRAGLHDGTGPPFTYQKTAEALSKFNNYRNSISQTHDNEKNYRNHFFNWIAKDGHLKTDIPNDNTKLSPRAQKALQDRAQHANS